MEFAALLDRRDIHVEFQPVVDLRSGEVVALEALARGPVGTRFASPRALFDAARTAGRVAELDWVCRVAAFDAFARAALPPALSLFINTEPEGFAAPCPADLTPLLGKAESLLRVFVEVNDEAMAADPAGVLAAVDRAREMGWGIAIDDVGSRRAPVAMLPIVQADVVKLDLRLLNEATSEDAAAMVTSVLRHVEETGASLLIERIESKEDMRWARALGAAYGQGLHLGAPGPLEEAFPAPAEPVPLVRAASTNLRIDSPFALFAGGAHRRMDRRTVDQLAALIARSPRTSETWPVFLACVGRDRELSESLVADVLGLPRRTLLLVVFGEGLPPEPAPGVRGVRVSSRDPLGDERFLVVLTDQTAVALLARRAIDGLYEVVVTQNPEQVYGIAHHLIRRVPAAGSQNTALSPVAEEERAEPSKTPAPAPQSRRSKRGRDRRWWN